MTYDLIVPTCKRPKLLREFVESVDKMTKDKSSITIHFIVDDTDKDTETYTTEIMQQFQGHFKMQLHYIQRKNDIWQFNINEDYYNQIARQTTGDMIWILADDLELTSPNWDEEANQEITNFTVKYPDKIFCVSMLDNTKPPSHLLPKFPCFPLFTRECIAGQDGWLLHPKVKTWGADYVTYCIFEPLGRLLQLHKKTYLNHKSWHTKQVAVDSTNEWIGMVFNQTKMVPANNTDRIINEEVPHIRGKIMDKVRAYQPNNIGV